MLERKSCSAHRMNTTYKIAHIVVTDNCFHITESEANNFEIKISYKQKCKSLT